MKPITGGTNEGEDYYGLYLLREALKGSLPLERREVSIAGTPQ